MIVLFSLFLIFMLIACVYHFGVEFLMDIFFGDQILKLAQKYPLATALLVGIILPVTFFVIVILLL